MIMPLADLVVIRVVCGGNLDPTGTERHGERGTSYG